MINNPSIDPASLLENLYERCPDYELITTIQPLSEKDFQLQKKKQKTFLVHAGSIGIIYTSRKKVVLVKRSRIHAGWSLPGGTLEPNEGFFDAFRREIKEELGIALKKMKLIKLENKKFVSPKGEELSFLLATFVAKISDDDLITSTELAIAEGLFPAFFDINDLPASMIMHDKEKIEDYFKNLNETDA